MAEQPQTQPHWQMIPVRPGGGRHQGFFHGPHEKATDTRRTLQRLWNYLRLQRSRLIAAFILVLLSSACTLSGPYLIGHAIDSMSRGQGQVNLERLSGITLALLVIYGLGALAAWLHTYLTVGVAQLTVRQLRQDLFDKMQTLPIRFFDSQTHGELMSRLTNDVDNVNNTLSQSVTQIFSSLITISGAVILMLWLNPLLTGLCMLVAPLGLLLTRKLAGYTKEYFSAQQKELGSLNGYIEEIISGQRVVKAFSHEAKAIKEFSEINNRLTFAGIRAQIFSGIIPPVMNLINNNMLFAIVATAGGWMAVKGMISVGVVASFLNYSKQFGRPLNELANQFNMIQSALAGAERVFELMDETPEPDDEPSAPAIPVTAGEVIFKDVWFGYQPGHPILKDIHLTVKPGQTIALVGPTGAGKTTVVNLLTRFYDMDRGEIWIDGKEIRTLPKNGLRRSLGIVLQDSYLFSDTVRENIRYGRLDASDAEVEHAARLANAHLFIERLPDGYDTVLSEAGNNLSQGQRQLLTIARAILADPAILILDEATSNVDTRTEMHIQQAMLKLMNGRTSFVIAHRLSTIRTADQILVIDGGRIIERGDHQQLLKAKGFYYDLYHSQFRRSAPI